MSEWRGLHEQDYHSPWLDGIRALCTICQQDCEADDVCYCCQRNAEVERLTVANKALQYGLRQSCADSLEHRRRIEKAYSLPDRDEREYGRFDEWNAGWNAALESVRDILRGESDE